MVAVPITAEFTDEDEKIVLRQIEHQELDEIQADAFRNAYKRVKEQAALDPIRSWDAEVLIRYVKYWAEILEPMANYQGKYRKVPIIFKNNTEALNYQLINGAMKKFAEAVVEGRLTPMSAFEEFEKIHPFLDGNGRLGHFIWATMCVRDVGIWPMALPPDVYGFSERNVKDGDESGVEG